MLIVRSFFLLGRIQEAQQYFPLLQNQDMIAFPDIITEFLRLFHQHKKSSLLRSQSLCYLTLFFRRVGALLENYLTNSDKNQANAQLNLLSLRQDVPLDLKVSDAYRKNPKKNNDLPLSDLILFISKEDQALLLKILHLFGKSFSLKESQDKLFALRLILKLFPQDLQARLEMSRVFTKRKLDRKALKVLNDLKKIDTSITKSFQYDGRFYNFLKEYIDDSILIIWDIAYVINNKAYCI